MSRTRSSRVPWLLAGLALVAGACGSGDGDDVANGSSTSVTEAAAAEEGTTTTTTTSTTVAATTSTIEEYLASVLEISGDLVLGQTGATAVASDSTLYSRELAIQWTEALDAIEALDPPPEAQEYHDRAVAGWGRFTDLVLAFEDGAREGGTPGQTAALAFAEESQALLNELLAIDSDLIDLAIPVFEAGADDLASYFADTWVIRQDFAPLVDEVFTSFIDPNVTADDAASAFRDLGGAAQQFAGSWGAVIPPAAANRLHAEQLDLMETLGSVASGLLEVLEDNTAPSSDLLLLIEEMAGRSPQVSADWAYFTAAYLRGDTAALESFGGAPDLIAGAGGGETPAEVDTTPVGVFELEVGVCFDDPDQFTEVETVDGVDCAEPHDNEVYFAADLDDGAYPGDEEVAAAADDLCFASFEPFVGIDYFDSILDFAWLVPTAGSWAQGDREVICFLYHIDLEKLEGSMEGAGI